MFATVIQATCTIGCLHGAMDHGRVQEFLLSFGAESISRSMIIFES